MGMIVTIKSVAQSQRYMLVLFYQRIHSQTFILEAAAALSAIRGLSAGRRKEEAGNILFLELLLGLWFHEIKTATVVTMHGQGSITIALRCKSQTNDSVCLR